MTKETIHEDIKNMLDAKCRQIAREIVSTVANFADIDCTNMALEDIEKASLNKGADIRYMIVQEDGVKTLRYQAFHNGGILHSATGENAKLRVMQAAYMRLFYYPIAKTVHDSLTAVGFQQKFDRVFDKVLSADQAVPITTYRTKIDISAIIDAVTDCVKDRCVVNAITYAAETFSANADDINNKMYRIQDQSE